MPYQNIHPAGPVALSANFNNIQDNTGFLDGGIQTVASKNTEQESWRDTVDQPNHDAIEIALTDLENAQGTGPGLYGGAWGTSSLPTVAQGSHPYLWWDTVIQPPSGVRLIDNWKLIFDIDGVWNIDATVLMNSGTLQAIWIGNANNNAWVKVGGNDVSEMHVTTTKRFRAGDSAAIYYFSDPSVPTNSNDVDPELHVYRIGP